LRVESLSAKVDFNERRVRGIEGVSARPPKPQDGVAARGVEDHARLTQPEPVAAVASSDAPTTPQQSAEGQPLQPGDAPRRRRRRRRGGRGAGGAAAPQEPSAVGATAGVVSDEQDDATDADEPLDSDITVPQSTVLQETTAAEPPVVSEAPL